MNRRGFLGVLGAVVAAPFVPFPAAPQTVGILTYQPPDVVDFVRWQVEDIARIFNVPAHLLCSTVDERRLIFPSK